MKKLIINILTVAVAAAAICSCNEAKYVTVKYVTLNSNKYTFSEDAGTVVIPVSLFGADECQVGFTIGDGTAKQGTDFTIVDKDGNPNTTGLVTLSSDKEKNDSIRVKLVYDPKLTKGKNFTITLGETNSDDVFVDGTTVCAVTINDLEYAVTNYFGSWITEDKSVSFEIEAYDIDEDPDEIAKYYPECCLTISSGGIDGTAISWAIYGGYDSSDKTIHIYGQQAYNAYNFGSIGTHYVVLENGGANYEEDVVFNTGDKELSFSDDGATVQLYSYPDGDRTTYYYIKIAGGTKLIKQ